MWDKLGSIRARHEDLAAEMARPEVVTDYERVETLAREHAALGRIIRIADEYRNVETTLSQAREIVAEGGDKDFVALAREDIAANEKRATELEQELKVALIPKDPFDQKNVIVEIRGAAGGEEAKLFTGDLFRMYSRYAERQSWKTEVLESHGSDIGGFKEIVFAVQGEGAYSRLKFESGVHRVQRVPVTEAGGRIHTSAATVAVLPEAEEIDIDIPASDIRIDTYRSSGAGGQHVNTTDSAVRITHIPTGIAVTSSEKSQHQNRANCMIALRARLYDLERQQAEAERAAERKGQVGSGDRSERIRTYNFPQGRVTDHRIGLTLYRLDQVMAGDLGEIGDALVAADQAARLAEMEA